MKKNIYSHEEVKTAMETMTCPRCGARLFYREVINAGGEGFLISREFGEIFDLYGHAVPVLIKDFIKAREKSCKQNV